MKELTETNCSPPRRAFEKHFKEWRHQNGMRAMGIPNSKMFYEVTKIDDAMALWNTIAVRHAASSLSVLWLLETIMLSVTSYIGISFAATALT